MSHEPITIVRKRAKDGTPGDWSILVPPTAPMADHLKKRASFLPAFPISDDVAEVRVARLEDISLPLKFRTQDEAKELEKLQSAMRDNQLKSDKDAANRQAAIDKKQSNEEAKAKAAAVAELNKQNDKIRETPKAAK